MVLGSDFWAQGREGPMPGRLQDEVERTVDQLVTLTLQSIYHTASATDQWMADLNEADSLEQFYLSHRAFLEELQHVAANDVACRLGIAARWFGASAPRRATASEAPPSSSRALESDSETPATSDQAQAESSLLGPRAVMALTAAALDSANLKALRGALHVPRLPERSTHPVGEESRATAVDAAAEKKSPPVSARAPLRATVPPRSKRLRA